MPERKQTGRYEYRLRVMPEYEEMEAEYRTVILLQTMREFASFRYELGMEEEKQGNTIRYRVTGLKTPQLSLPDSGPAYFRRTYSGLRGTVEITIEGLDKRVNTFVFDVAEKHVTLKHAPKESFVEINTEPEHPL